jgi:hypothetical protein
MLDNSPMMTMSSASKPRRPTPANNPLTSAIPGFDNLAGGASSLVQNLLSGLPSAAPAQRQAAYFGVNSGMPGSDFARNRGYDLYGEQAEAFQQRGFDDFLKLLQGYSGTVAPTAGQTLQQRQANAEMISRQRQADAQLGLDRKAQELNELKAGKGVPWNSTSTGDMYDKFGGRLNYDQNFDRRLR